VSVDTHVRGRNLTAYRRIAVDPGLQVLVASQLLAVAARVRIARTGTVLRRLTAEVSSPAGAAGGCAV
jgi:hypothetical protein